ncbi:type IV pilus modification PilV family protein [Leifsonia sp. P73]|uniref:type IV pilus modification PilV family protein n=1 Tax=Leifsonia sp. P73 TaxID=3423959 RepID=UPI003DA47164
MNTTRLLLAVRRTRSVDDSGFGVAEVLVAMFLLGLIAVAIIPILVQGLRLSVQNATVATATQLANQQVEQVRGVTSCASVVAGTITTTSQNVPLKAVRTVGTTCPASGYPITVKVSVSVTRTDTNAVLATANTLVFVTGP